MFLWFVLASTALAGPVTVSGDTGAPVPTAETGSAPAPAPEPDDGEFCANCETAAARSGEEGGSPCGSGCSSAPASGLLILPLLAMVGLRRRTAR